MSNQPVVIAGSILLLVGWYVSVTAQTPWQAIAVSGMGLWLLIARLRLWWKIRDLTAIFLLVTLMVNGHGSRHSFYLDCR